MTETADLNNIDLLKVSLEEAISRAQEDYHNFLANFHEFRNSSRGHYLLDYAYHSNSGNIIAIDDVLLIRLQAALAQYLQELPIDAFILGTLELKPEFLRGQENRTVELELGTLIFDEHMSSFTLTTETSIELDKRINSYLHNFAPIQMHSINIDKNNLIEIVFPEDLEN